MSQELNSPPRVSADKEASRATPNANGVQFFDPRDLSKLMDRCQDDLKFMDSVLSELENAQEQGHHVEASRLIRVDSAESINKPQFLNSRIATIGAESIHRMANDIEELYRVAEFGDVQTMLGNLQSKMAHCLRLLPASAEMSHDATNHVAD